MRTRQAPLLGLILSAIACGQSHSTDADEASAPVTSIPAAGGGAPAVDAAAPPVQALDATDLAAFALVKLAAVTARTASDRIWKEDAAGVSYRFDKLPTYFIRRSATLANERAYLVQHPSPQGTLMTDPVFAEIAPVYRYDAQKNVIGDGNFDYTAVVAGTESYVFPYKPAASATDDDPSVPTSNQFFYYLVHEAFHRFQLVEDAWTERPGWTQDEAKYPLNRENVALGLLEEKVLIAGINAVDPAAKTEALQQLIAIRKARIALPSVIVGGVNFVVNLDNAQENTEGTALYAELRFGEAARPPGGFTMKDDLIQRLERAFHEENFQTVADLREDFVFGREYATGAATGALLDQVDAGDWRSSCKNGDAPYDFAARRWPEVAGASADAKVASAKTTYHYDAILAEVDRLLALPPGPPPDTGEMADGSGDMPGGAQAMRVFTAHHARHERHSLAAARGVIRRMDGH